MPVPKPTDPKAARPPLTGGKQDRKPWKKKSPVEVVLEQAEEEECEAPALEGAHPLKIMGRVTADYLF